MDVGIACGIRNLPGKEVSLPTLYEEFINEARLADELGFSHMWLSEHHFAEDDWNTQPLTVLAAAATHTRRIRLGTYVLLLALHDPLDVAEAAATVDILSNGRLDLVIGAGPMIQECEVYGIAKNETFARTYEALAFIQRCFTEESVTHEGKYYQYRDVRLRPKSVQKPHPPIYMAAMGPQSIDKTAQRGYHLASALHSPFWKEYPGLLEKYGRRRADQHIVSGPVCVHIAPSREQAWDEAEEALHWGVDFYCRRGMVMPLPPVGEMRRVPNAGIYGVPFAVGTAEDVLERLSIYRDEPIDELALQFHAPGMKSEHVQRSMRTFSEELLPQIRRWGAAGGA
jgi:alkanesulfonate monooxygenase SsuD/methylene tetrahydromethanopterin reductase-like flavin-dependent oxidoreductase (luciferase family)